MQISFIMSVTWSFYWIISVRSINCNQTMSQITVLQEITAFIVSKYEYGTVTKYCFQ